MTVRVLAFLSLWGTSFSPLPGQQASPRTPAPALAGLSRSFEQIVEHVTPSVVQVIAVPPHGLGERSSGSGVVVDEGGYILTNAHVVGVARRVQVLAPVPAERLAASKSVIKPAGKLVSAQVVGIDRETDIAVLKTSHQGLTPLRFGDSEALRQGQLVFAFGSPFGLENSVTLGIVSSAARQVRPDHPMIYVQTDASINPGNSGGPLVDAEGAIVGLNTFILSNSGANAGVGFAAPSNIVRSVFEQIRDTGRVRRGQIGIQAQTITPQLAAALKLGQDGGVLVGDIVPGGSAEAAGLQIKDILLTLNGKPLENARQFGVNVYRRAGETITLEILRGSEKLTKQVAVLERPRDTEQVLSLAAGDANVVASLKILALDLDAKTTAMLPPLRRLSGAVVAGNLTNDSEFFPGDVIYSLNETKVDGLAGLKSAVQTFKPGDPVAVQIERLGQLQYLVVEIQ
ncbi:MAG TPA: trypsin-like peptidase domain-containing protein [Bryobacteraceae bacterium]|nr:trypsin-like peptidase domain-containing protein [Bryobacteraceae bacterium]